MNDIQGSRIYTFLVHRSTPPYLQFPIQSVHISWQHGLIPCSFINLPIVSSIIIQKITDDDINNMLVIKSHFYIVYVVLLHFFSLFTSIIKYYVH